MKTTVILALAILAAALTGCRAQQNTVDTVDPRDEISWSAFCAASGHDLADADNADVYSEYLDSWCGSAEEDAALINAGYEPF